MNNNTYPQNYVPGVLPENCVPRSALKQSSFVSNKIYSNYSSVKQTSSGSETDVSTSTENLTPEERYVLKTGIRQEPQGEETYLDMNAANDGLSFNNTLIIHENGILNGYNFISPILYGKLASIYADVKDTKNDGFIYHNHSISEKSPMGPVISDKTEQIGKSNIVSMVDNDSHYSNLNSIKFTNQATMPCNQPLFIDNESVIKLQSPGEQQKNASPDSSYNLQQPMLNNYLNSLKKNDSLMIKNFNADNVTLPPPPPEYEKQWSQFQISPNASKSCERLAISRSHPDLSKFGDDELNNNSNNTAGRTNGSFADSVHPYSFGQNSFQRNSTFDMLLTENASLRSQLELYVQKVKKLQNFELDIQKVHQSHEELIASSEKKEKLERALRFKLEIQIRRLQEENRCLKEQLESTSVNKRGNFSEGDIDSLELKKEINKRDVLISRLLAQSKEYITDKERQEIELQAQRLTLQEQRNHIEILDTALMNAQNNIISLETELRKKHEFEEKTLFLKKALSNLQLANDRRLQMEKRARAQLEKEIEELKKQNATEINNGEAKHDEKDIDSLKRTIRDYEEKLISLESEVSKWEQKYLEESTLRSIEVSAASAPKDAKIAALERTSQESEKLIAEARNERLKHMDDIHLANKKFAELESKMKDVESKLAEKDAMIKVLQKHSEDRDAVLQKTLVRRFPNRHTRSASTMGLVVSNAVGNSISASAVTSSDALSGEFGKLLVSNSNPRSTCSMTNNLVLSAECTEPSINNAIDEQLREMDSRLSPKDSLIKALRNEKERYPNHYNNWRL